MGNTRLIKVAHPDDMAIQDNGQVHLGSKLYSVSDSIEDDDLAVILKQFRHLDSDLAFKSFERKLEDDGYFCELFEEDLPLFTM